MPERLLALACRVDRNRQPFGDVSLPDHLVHAPRPQGDLIVAELAERFAIAAVLPGVAQSIGRKNRFPGHRHTRAAKR
jgi:hypothetical protein